MTSEERTTLIMEIADSLQTQMSFYLEASAKAKDPALVHELASMAAGWSDAVDYVRKLDPHFAEQYRRFHHRIGEWMRNPMSRPVPRFEDS